MNVIVIGCGKLGRMLAEDLNKDGHNVAIIDDNADRFLSLDGSFNGVTVTGMPMDIDTLRNAGVEFCDAVAVVTSDDNLNITVSEILVNFLKIENVVTRITDPSKWDFFSTFGLQTVCSTDLTCSSIYSIITGKNRKNIINIDKKKISVEIEGVQNEFVGRLLKEVNVREDQSLIGIIDKNGEIFFNNSYNNVVLSKGDQLIISKKL